MIQAVTIRTLCASIWNITIIVFSTWVTIKNPGLPRDAAIWNNPAFGQLKQVFRWVLKLGGWRDLKSLVFLHQLVQCFVFAGYGRIF